jgi:hypothetical protein
VRFRARWFGLDPKLLKRLLDAPNSARPQIPGDIRQDDLKELGVVADLSLEQLGKFVFGGVGIVLDDAFKGELRFG